MHTLLLALLLAAPQPGAMGTMDFPVTGGPACQRKFLEGMLALHSFMYEHAHRHFQAAVKAEPDCAMARWGDAMAYSHPLWGEEDLPAARAALAGATSAEAGLTPKERAFLTTARALFGEGDAAARERAWLKATERMHADFPADDEVTLEHALALIANNDRYTNVRRSMEAAALAMDVMQRNPNHPGAAHYLIHACDSPEHAVLALPAAQRYARIAPAASHALHMPSHIFVQLGMYEQVAASNEASYAASQVEDKELGKKPDERDWHSYGWLVDALLNLGQHKRAEAMVRAFRELLIKDDGAETRFGYAQALQSYLNITGRWDQLELLGAPLATPLPLEKGEAAGSPGCGLHLPGQSGARPPWGLIAGLLLAELRGQAAMAAGDEAAVAAAYLPTAALQAAIAPWGKGGLYTELRTRQELLPTALQAAARARKQPTAEAWSTAAAAFQRLAAAPELMADGPAFVPPASHLFGDALLGAGRPKEALAAYDKSLQQHPSLSRSLLGAARAAKAAGEPAIARERYGALSKLWAHADPDLPALAEVRAALAR